MVFYCLNHLKSNGTEWSGMERIGKIELEKLNVFTDVDVVLEVSVL